MASESPSPTAASCWASPPRALLALADAVEAAPVFDSVWMGDALFVNRRLDVLTLLAAVAGWTERVLLGPTCTGSIALRDPRVFAYEWAERAESPPDFGDFPQPAELRRRYPVI